MFAGRPGGHPHIQRIHIPTAGEWYGDSRPNITSWKIEAQRFSFLSTPNPDKDTFASSGEFSRPAEPEYPSAHAGPKLEHGVSTPLREAHAREVNHYPFALASQRLAHQLAERYLVAAHLAIIVFELGRKSQLYHIAEGGEEMRCHPHTQALPTLGGSLGVGNLCWSGPDHHHSIHEVMDGTPTATVAWTMGYSYSHVAFF